jgi:hypothetical protein
VPRQNLDAYSLGHGVGDGREVELQLLHSRSSYQACAAMDKTEAIVFKGLVLQAWYQFTMPILTGDAQFDKLTRKS